MKFSRLTGYFQKLELTPSRNEMTEILAELLAESDSTEADKVCYLSLGRLSPLYAGIEFNLAEKMMIRVLAKAYGEEEQKISKKYKKLGDLGDAAASLDKRQTGVPLSIGQVYDRLYKVAAEVGEGSVERKIGQMAKLLDDLDAQSAKYVARIPRGKLRLGFSDKTILDALSWLIAGDKSKREEIEAAYNIRADVGQVAKTIKLKGLKGLKGLKVQVGVPVVPALCQRLPTAEEMVAKLGVMAVEPKLDGTRLQIHFSQKKKWQTKENQIAFDFQPAGFVSTFTRNLESTTHMFPDLVQAVFKEVKAQEAILDCEAIGYNPKTKRLLPFQETIKRKRKYGISKKMKELPLKFFCFDVLFKDGRDLLKTPFAQRRKILEKILPLENQTLILTPQIVTDNPRELREYHDEQIKKGLEGVVVKKWHEIYDPGRRGYTWVKFKQEEGKKGGGLADTLDGVVMGYYRGRGKRAEFGIGAFLVGVIKKPKIKNQKPKTQMKNKENDNFESLVTISKIGTGLTDEQWRELKVQSSKLEVQSRPKEYQVDKNLAPDVWLNPGMVAEIEADNITKSPIHTAKYALRFPRLVRFRDDKSPDQATTLKEVEKLYRLQK